MWKCQQSLRKIQHPTALLDEHVCASASSRPNRHTPSLIYNLSFCLCCDTCIEKVSSAFCGSGPPFGVNLLAAEAS